MSMINTLRKGIAALSVFALSLMTMPATFANVGDFTDFREIPTWVHEAVNELIDQGVINGNADGSFAPNRPLNRAEVSKIIVLATGVELDTAGGTDFSDVAESDWFFDYVATMYNFGWINGYPDNSFGPGLGINRAELAKMVVNAFELDIDTTGAPHFDDVPEGEWFFPFVETAYNNGLMRGYSDGTFKPNNSVTRAETVKIVYDAQLVVAEPIGPAEGTLEIALSPDTPRGTNIPFNATSVPYTTLEFTASDDSDVEISAITITRLGLGDNDDFDNVWLEIDGFKVGNDKSVNNDDITELRFNPPIVVPAGQTLVGDIVASMDETEASISVGAQNRLVMVSADDVASTAANVVGDFPIEGEEMEIANYQVTELGFSTLGSDTTVDVGDNFIEIGKFRLEVQSPTNKDTEMRAITFKNDGQADLGDVLENIALYVSGEQVSAESIIDGDYVTFRLDNGVTGGYVIEDGDSRVFSIRADIVSAEDSDVVNFKVDNFEDIVAVEIGTSFGARAVSDDSAATVFSNGTTQDVGNACANDADAEDDCARLRAYAIDTGDLNISRDPSSLGNQEYAPGSNDVVFLTARLVVDQPLIVDGLSVEVANGSNVVTSGTGLDNSLEELNLQFDNFRVFLNDSLIDSENSFIDADTGDDDITTNPNSVALDFNTTFEIAGTSILKVIGNIENLAQTGTNLRLRVDAVDFESPEYISTGDQVDAEEELLGSAEGSIVEVRESILEITNTDGLSDGETIVGGINDVTFLKFVLDINDSGDGDVTSVTIDASDEADLSGNTRTFQNFTLAIFVDGLQQGSSRNLSSTGQATFNDLNVIIPSASQKEFTLVANTIEASATEVSGIDQTAPAAAAPITTITVEADDVNAINQEAGEIDQIDLIEGGITERVDVLTNVAGVLTFAATANNFTAGTVIYDLVHTIAFDVIEVDGDNVENGQTIPVELSNGTALGVAPNQLEGAVFELVQSGSLTVSNREVSAFDRIIVANSSEVTVAEVNFTGSDDNIRVGNLNFVNDLDNNVVLPPTLVEQQIDDRVDFKLYNEAGQFVIDEQMTNGTLQFDLANQDRIVVPKDGRTFVTIRVDARNLTNATETGAQLRLALDANPANPDPLVNQGIEAFTGATGDDIEIPVGGWGETPFTVTTPASTVVADSDFIVTRTKVSIAHSPANDNLTLSGGTAVQGIYRFQVSADNAFDATIERLSFDVSFSGAALAAALAPADLELVEYGNSGFTGTPVSQTGTFVITTPTTAGGLTTFDFASTEEVNAGTTRYYEIRIAGNDVVLSTGDNDRVNVLPVGSDDTTVGPQGVDRAAALANAVSATDFRMIWSDRSNDGNPGAYLTGFAIVMPTDTDGAQE